MDNALLAERYPLWKRLCPELKNIDFIHLGLQRCIGQADNGSHFLQTAEEVYGEQVPHSTYFNHSNYQGTRACSKQLSCEAKTAIVLGYRRMVFR